jgi:hypothetical protein
MLWYKSVRSTTRGRKFPGVDSLKPAKAFKRDAAPYPVDAWSVQ